MTRRSFVAGTAAAATTASDLIRTAVAADNDGEFSLAQLHDEVAAHAARLAAGRDIALTLLLPRGSLANVEAVGRAFAEATGVRLAYMEVPVDDINTRMMIDFMSGSRAFDLALPATFGLPDLIEAGVLLRLDDFADRFQPADLQRASLYAIGDYYKDALYGYQTDGDTYLMFYNRPWLENPEENKRFADRHGYELKIPDTWAELDAMMAHFHRPDDGRYGGALFRTPTYMAWEFWVRFHAKGFWPFDDEMEPHIGNEAGVAALEELIAASRHLYPDAGHNGLFENFEAFAKGNIFCNIGWGGTQKYLAGPTSNLRDKLAFGPTPGGVIEGELLQTPYFNWGWNYTVSSATAEPELAYLFALFAISPEMSTRAVRERDGYFDPFRVEHYADPTVLETYSPTFLAAHRESLTRSIPDLYLKGQGEYFSALRENIRLANAGDITAKKALMTTTKQWRQITRRMGRRGQIEQWHYLRTQYPSSVRRRLT